jgi:hypothetical protein
MVSVSLLKLVSLPGTREAWPDDFAGKVAVLDEAPGEKAAYGVIADWCDENGEPELGRAFRWVMRRETVSVENARPSHQKPPYWTLRGTSAAVANLIPQSAHRGTIPGLMADLAAALAAMDREAS